MNLFRSRFVSSADDYRPVVWPPYGPYWCSGYDSNDNAIIVAYTKTKAQIKECWPEADNIEAEKVDKIIYTSRFRKPSWVK